MKTAPDSASQRPEGRKSSNPAIEARVAILSLEESERRLLNQLQDQNQDHKPTWSQLAMLYGDAGYYDRALGCLRELMALEPELERKAACVLAMGANAEKQQNFQAAVRFYREALAMEPTHNDVWYFIHNNLGYSLNMLGQFHDGEKFCRTAIDINPARPNGHKNLGIALHGEGRHAEAAQCFITATKVNSGDARSLGLLRDLILQDGELEFEFGPELVRCEQAVSFANWAIRRAAAGGILKILIGCNEPALDQMLSRLFLSMTGGAVETSPVSHWSQFIDRACSGDFDLGFVLPNNRCVDDDGSGTLQPWAFADGTMRRIRGNSSTVIIVGGDSAEVNEHGQASGEAGVDAVIELPFSSDELADAVRRCLMSRRCK